MMAAEYLGYLTWNHCLARILEPSPPLLLAGRWVMGAGPLGARPGAYGGDLQTPAVTPTFVWGELLAYWMAILGEMMCTHLRLCSRLKGSEMTQLALTLRHRVHGSSGFR
jgi:hypothetical protein